ncbi:MAG: T9SS type A sorting domain-containing protein [Bacteroidales bacterium]|nr:T9SS type A sorting domain-containing protein [Bacteroidales bacterium]
MILFSVSVSAQGYAFNDFVGTWHGNISSTYFGGYNDPMTMTIEPDGFYTETSGQLMPTLYPNTQQCEYESASNRMHWWYLGTVWGGQYFYEHHFYEVVYFQNDTLIMHYNFWDDPIPNPDAGTISLTRVTTTPAPENLDLQIFNGLAQLTWDEPNSGGNPIADLSGYNVYRSYELGAYELVTFTEETSYLIENGATAGLNSYSITAVYDQGESLPSNELLILFDTPEPMALQGTPLSNNIVLDWSAPNPGSGVMATLLGYNVYHKFEDDTFELAGFTESFNFIHENLNPGTHHYYVTAVYDGGESDPSTQIEVTLLTTSLGESTSRSDYVYPNPVSDFLFIHAEENISRLSLVNQSGQSLLSVESPESNQQIDVSHLSSGIYFLLIETNTGLISKKLMIE